MPDTTQPTETWLPVQGAPGYEVSDMGRVRSVPRTVLRRDGKPLRVAGCICKLRMHRGYWRVSIVPLGTSPVHRLVAVAFVPCPGDPAELTVNHIDGNKSNNRPGNLEWMTASDNARHGHMVGLNDSVGRANGRAKIVEADARLIRHLYSLGHTQVALAKRFGIDQTSISRIVLRKNWTHVA